MLSRAEMRVRLEHVLRGVVIAVLAVMLWQSLHPQGDSAGQTVSAHGVGGTLAKWSVLAKVPRRIHVQLDSMPSPLERAWLGALAGGGSSVTWSGNLPPVMIDALAVASPAGGTRVTVSAPSGSSMVRRDYVGVIDTARVHNGVVVVAL